MKDRIDTDEYFLRMATLISLRSTCARRHTGCIVINERRHVLATGYNGVAAGQDHCEGERECPGATAEPGASLSECHAIHAESNALLQCNNVHNIHTSFSTDSPCIHCIKLLLNTSCQRIVFSRRYPHTEPENLWRRSGRDWCFIDLTWPFTLEQSFYRPSTTSVEITSRNDLTPAISSHMIPPEDSHSRHYRSACKMSPNGAHHAGNDSTCMHCGFDLI